MTRLIVVTLLLAAVAVVLKLRTRTTTVTRTIKVTSRVSLNRGSMVAVIEVDGRRLLVGAAANHVTLLTELNESAEADGSAVADLSISPSTTVFPSKSSVTPSRRDRPNKTRVVGNHAADGSAITKPATALIEKARQVTTRTADAKLRLPHRQSGAA